MQKILWYWTNWLWLVLPQTSFGECCLWNHISSNSATTAGVYQALALPKRTPWQMRLKARRGQVAQRRDGMWQPEARGHFPDALMCVTHVPRPHTPLTPDQESLPMIHDHVLQSATRSGSSPSPWWKPDMQSALTPKALLGLSGRQFNLMKYTQSHVNGESFSKGFLQPCVGSVYSSEMTTAKTYIFKMPDIVVIWFSRKPWQRGSYQFP